MAVIYLVLSLILLRNICQTNSSLLFYLGGNVLSIIDLLANEEVWEAFLEYKRASVLSPKLIKRYEFFINNKQYKNIVTSVIKEEYIFAIPRKITINKIRNNKKRIVYLYNKEEASYVSYCFGRTRNPAKRRKYRTHVRRYGYAFAHDPTAWVRGYG